MPMSFERSEDTSALVEALRKVNGAIEYSGLVQLTGLPLRRVKSVLPSARRVLLREKILFGTIRGYGLQRLSDVEKARTTEAVKSKIRRAAGKGLKALDTIEHFEAMPNIDQLVVTTNKTVLQLIQSQTMTPVPKSEPARAPQAVANVSELIPKKNVK